MTQREFYVKLETLRKKYNFKCTSHNFQPPWWNSYVKEYNNLLKEYEETKIGT